MSKNIASVLAPSNIALIKYMGKKEGGSDLRNAPHLTRNLPMNGSLSLTLSHLCTAVEVAEASGGQPEVLGDFRPYRRGKYLWIPELPRFIGEGGFLSSQSAQGALLLKNPLNCHLPFQVPSLKSAGIERMLEHVKQVEAVLLESLPQLGIEVFSPKMLEIRTANTFPASSGIASSASSFAGITLAVALAICEDQAVFKNAWLKGTSLRRMLASLARQGSGSSCRSFEGPWVSWEGAESQKVEEAQAMPPLTDLVLLVSTSSKKVSSSQAHLLVQSSPLWHARVERCTQRLVDLKQALAAADLVEVSRIAWEEMWEMHSLFHTCREPFTYWEADTIAVLRWLGDLKSSLASLELPPIVTLDAGPNIHILVQTTEARKWKLRIQEKFPNLKILEDNQGQGALWVEP